MVRAVRREEVCQGVRNQSEWLGAGTARMPDKSTPGIRIVTNYVLREHNRKPRPEQYRSPGGRCKNPGQ